DLDGRQRTAFAGLRALRHLNFKFVGVDMDKPHFIRSPRNHKTNSHQFFTAENHDLFSWRHVAFVQKEIVHTESVIALKVENCPMLFVLLHSVITLTAETTLTKVTVGPVPHFHYPCG